MRISVVPVASASYDWMFPSPRLQMEDRQQPFGGERPEKQTLAAATVVDELATDRAVHAFRGAPRSRIASCGRSSLKLSDRTRSPEAGPPRFTLSRNRVKGADRVHGNWMTRGVIDLDADFTPVLIVHELQDADEIRLPGAAGVRNRQDRSGPQRVGYFPCPTSWRGYAAELREHHPRRLPRWIGSPAAK